LGAIRIPELSAAVCFYGLPPANVANPGDIRVPLQGHFANEDDWCTPAAVDGFEAALKKVGKAAEIFRYDAKHGFMNEQRPRARAARRGRGAGGRPPPPFGGHPLSAGGRRAALWGGMATKCRRPRACRGVPPPPPRRGRLAPARPPPPARRGLPPPLPARSR